MAGVHAGHAAGRHHRRPVRAGLSAVRAAARGPHPAAGPARAEPGDLPGLPVRLVHRRRVHQPAAADPGVPLAAPRHPARPTTTRRSPRLARTARAEDADLPLGDQRHELVLGAIVFIVASWPVASHAAPVVAVATAAGRHRDRRSSATCSPSGCCARSRWPRCAAACRRTSTPRRDPAPGADLGAVHRRARAGDRAGGGGQQVRHPARLGRPADHPDPADGHRRPGDRSGRQRAGRRCRSPTRCASCAGRSARCSAATTTRTCRSTTPANWACCRPASTTWCATWPSGSGCATCSAATSARTSPGAPWSAAPNSAARNATSPCCSSTSSARRSWRRPAPPARSSACSTSSSGSSSTPSSATAASSTSSRATRRWPSSARRSSTPTPPVRRWPPPANCTTS